MCHLAELENERLCGLSREGVKATVKPWCSISSHQLSSVILSFGTPHRIKWVLTRYPSEYLSTWANIYIIPDRGTLSTGYPNVHRGVNYTIISNLYIRMYDNTSPMGNAQAGSK